MECHHFQIVSILVGYTLYHPLHLHLHQQYNMHHYQHHTYTPPPERTVIIRVYEHGYPTTGIAESSRVARISDQVNIQIRRGIMAMW